MKPVNLKPSSVDGQYLAELVEFGVSLHAPEADLWERLAPRGSAERQVQRNIASLFRHKPLRQVQVCRKWQPLVHILQRVVHTRHKQSHY